MYREEGGGGVRDTVGEPGHLEIPSYRGVEGGRASELIGVVALNPGGWILGDCSLL